MKTKPLKIKKPQCTIALGLFFMLQELTNSLNEGSLPCFWRVNVDQNIVVINRDLQFDLALKRGIWYKFLSYHVIYIYDSVELAVFVLNEDAVNGKSYIEFFCENVVIDA